MFSQIAISAFIVLGVVSQGAFGASSPAIPSPRASVYDCYSCIGDQDSNCAKDPETVTGNTSFEGVISLENPTISCPDSFYCVSLVLQGTIAGQTETVTYRDCSVSCKVLKDTILAAIPPTVGDVTVKSCNDCQKAKCNSSVIVQAIVILIVTMTMFVRLL